MRDGVCVRVGESVCVEANMGGRRYRNSRICDRSGGIRTVHTAVPCRTQWAMIVLVAMVKDPAYFLDASTGARTPPISRRLLICFIFSMLTEANVDNHVPH